VESDLVAGSVRGQDLDLKNFMELLDGIRPDPTMPVQQIRVEGRQILGE
jgi:hypothetical protein